MSLADQQVLAEIRASWQGVGSMTSRINIGLAGSMGSGSFTLLSVVDVAYNLPFLHACAVLNDVLRQMAREQKFSSKAQTLGALYQDSLPSLWIDPALMAEIIDRRNRLAHDGETFPREQCWKDIATIEAQLRSWQIVA